MLGYPEPPYTVEKKYVIHYTRHQEVAELRVPSNDSQGRYISLMLYRRDGKLIGDHLLMYKDSGSEHLDRDWNELYVRPKLDFDGLHFSERIVDHHIGYRRDGSVIMY